MKFNELTGIYELDDLLKDQNDQYDQEEQKEQQEQNETLWVVSPMRAAASKKAKDTKVGALNQEPFKHTFQARYHPDEDMIFIAETYEGRKAGFFLEDQEARLRSMGATPDPDLSYAWNLSYTPENWSKAMLFIRDTDGLLEPDRTQYGMCWHCNIVVQGATCPHCGKRVQTWYNTDLEIESGPMANVEPNAFTRALYQQLANSPNSN